MKREINNRQMRALIQRGY